MPPHNVPSTAHRVGYFAGYWGQAFAPGWWDVYEYTDGFDRGKEDRRRGFYPKFSIPEMSELKVESSK